MHMVFLSATLLKINASTTIVTLTMLVPRLVLLVLFEARILEPALYFLGARAAVPVG